MTLWSPAGHGPDDFAVDVPPGWRVHSVIEVLGPDYNGGRSGLRVLLEVIPKRERTERYWDE
jgi:hypothetical protein